MKSKRQVIAEGQRKGLERALEALNVAIIAESKKKGKKNFGNFPKKKVFIVGYFSFLEKHGFKDGEVRIDGNIIREGISRGRWTHANVFQRLKESLDNAEFSIESLNHTNNRPVVEVYCILNVETKTYLNKVIIDKETQKITSMHAISPLAYEKAKSSVR